MIRGVSGVLLAAGLLTAAHAQTDYEIRLHRPGKAGDRYHLTAVGHDTKASTATSEGRPPRANRHETAVELEGVVTLLEADAAGVSRAEIRIERATREESGKRTELLPAGTTLLEYLVGDNGVVLWVVDRQRATDPVTKQGADVTAHGTAERRIA